MKSLNADLSFAKARDERTKALHADPDFAKARDERTKALHADPAFAIANSERMKAQHADPVFAKAHSERMKIQNSDLVFQRKVARGMAVKPSWPEARFYGLIFGWFNGSSKDFRFQEVLPTPSFGRVVDARLEMNIFELDGGGHNAHRDRSKRDRIADEEHRMMGYRVIRATNESDLFLRVLQIVEGQ